MLKFLFLLFFLTYSNVSFAKEYKDQFAILNTVCKKDIDLVVKMYRSILSRYKGNGKFYVVTPKRDLIDIKNRFDKEKFSKSPIFLTDEEILSKCHIYNIDNLEIIKDGSTSLVVRNKDDHSKSYRIKEGWYMQQIIKLCFSKTKLARHYLSIDSDVFALKDFDENIFYNREKNIFKIVHINHRNENIVDFIFNDIYSGLNQKNTTKDKGFFVSEPGLYNSDVLSRLEKYIQTLPGKHKLENFYEMIERVPFEMQWQGQYLMSVEPNNFIPFEALGATIHGNRSLLISSKRNTCRHFARTTSSFDYKDKTFFTIQSGSKTRTQINNISDIDKIDEICKKEFPVYYKFLKFYYDKKCKLFDCPVDNMYLGLGGQKGVFVYWENLIKNYIYSNSSIKDSIKFFNPYKIYDKNGNPFKKVRYGSKEDGGYALYQEVLNKSDVMLSYGIADDINFEIEFIKKNPNKKVYAFDCSIDKLPVDNKDIIFIKECIGNSNNIYNKETNKNILIIKNLEEQIKDLGLEKKKIFIKMDIEGAEFEALDNIKQSIIDNIIGIVIEVHFINEINLNKLNKLINFFNKNFILYHIHGNNYSTYKLFKNKIQVPNVIELSLINKNLVGKKEFDLGEFPGKFDSANFSKKVDINLNMLIKEARNYVQ